MPCSSSCTRLTVTDGCAIVHSTAPGHFSLCAAVVLPLTHHQHRRAACEEVHRDRHGAGTVDDAPRRGVVGRKLSKRDGVPSGSGYRYRLRPFSRFSTRIHTTTCKIAFSFSFFDHLIRNPKCGPENGERGKAERAPKPIASPIRRNSSRTARHRSETCRLTQCPAQQTLREPLVPRLRKGRCWATARNADVPNWPPFEQCNALPVIAPLAPSYANGC